MNINKFLVYGKNYWKKDIVFNWSETEINEADAKGFIGSKWGIDCYITQKL